MMTFGRYTVRGTLGRGGFAEVYRAWDPLLGREVALKVLHPALSTEGATRRRFVREARIAARLQQPNLVHTYDAGEADGRLFFAMERIGGSTLDQLVHERGPLPLVQVASILTGLAAGIDYLHGQGLVHRDIKAANVLLEDTSGRVVLTDFGIARALESIRQTSEQTFLGSWTYVAPERWQGEPGGPPADIYALGVLIYYLLGGQPPFTGSATALAYAHVHQVLPSLHALRPDLPPPVSTVIERALAKRPEERPARAGELARTFMEAISGASSLRSLSDAASNQRTARVREPADGYGRQPLPVPMHPVPRWSLAPPLVWLASIAALLIALVSTTVIADREPGREQAGPPPSATTPRSEQTGERVAPPPLTLPPASAPAASVPPAVAAHAPGDPSPPPSRSIALPPIDAPPSAAPSPSASARPAAVAAPPPASSAPPLVIISGAAAPRAPAAGAVQLERGQTAAPDQRARDREPKDREQEPNNTDKKEQTGVQDTKEREKERERAQKEREREREAQQKEREHEPKQDEKERARERERGSGRR